MIPEQIKDYPPLPSPGVHGLHAFSETQIREYGALCRKQALAEPAQKDAVTSFDVFASGFDTCGNTWQDMGANEYFYAGWGAALAAGAQPTWNSTDERMPSNETLVLCIVNGGHRVLSRELEDGGYESSYPPFWFWDDPANSGTEIADAEVTHWQVLPTLPAGIQS